jgi:hypothetical protein
MTVAERLSAMETLRRVLVDLLAEHWRDGALPTIARFLFYELDSSINELFFRVPEIRGRRLLIVDWA